MTRKFFKERGQVFLVAHCVLLLLCGCGPQAPYSLAATVSPAPITGRIVTLRLQVTTEEAHPSFAMGVHLPKGVVLVSGTTEWTGAVAANTPVAHDLEICVLQAGEWIVYYYAVARDPGSGANLENRRGAVVITSAENEASIVPGSDYKHSQNGFGFDTGGPRPTPMKLNDCKA